MARWMINGTHANMQAIRNAIASGEMLGYYVTGTPGIRATISDLATFTGHVRVSIDQGGPGSPVPTATVRDVESGAWTVASAVQTHNWTAKRPTIYCSLDTVPEVQAAGWRGDLWLAIPGYTPSTPPTVKGCTVVAVQRTFDPEYELSSVYDDSWPYDAPKTAVAPGISVTVYSRRADLAFPRNPDAGHYVIQYQDTAGDAPLLLNRVAQPDDEPSIHEDALPVPGASGGTITVWAIVNSVPVKVGSAKLP